MITDSRSCGSFAAASVWMKQLNALAELNKAIVDASAALHIHDRCTQLQPLAELYMRCHMAIWL